jgi:hypothetical protein
MRLYYRISDGVSPSIKGETLITPGRRESESACLRRALRRLIARPSVARLYRNGDGYTVTVSSVPFD